MSGIRQKLAKFQNLVLPKRLPLSDVAPVLSGHWWLLPLLLPAHHFIRYLADIRGMFTLAPAASDFIANKLLEQAGSPVSTAELELSQAEASLPMELPKGGQSQSSCLLDSAGRAMASSLCSLLQL